MEKLPLKTFVEICVEKQVCVKCGLPAFMFKNAKAAREYETSGLCQLCQDIEIDDLEG